MDFLNAFGTVLNFIILIPKLLWTFLNIIPTEISKNLVIYIPVFIAVFYWKARK